MKLVHGDLKRDLSEMRKRPKWAKVTASPPSLSPPSKKTKEEDTPVEVEDLEARIEEEDFEARIEEIDLEARIEDLRRPNTHAQQKKLRILKDF